MKIESNEILLQNFDLARIVNEMEEHFPIVRYQLFKNPKAYLIPSAAS